MQTKDKVALNYEVYETTDYGQFKYLDGNRNVDKAHVKALAKKMEKEGNLMPERPVEVTENREVLDGQTRIAAAELNKMKVYYRVIPNATIDTTISFNTGNKNWNWLDFASSFAQRGNTNYKEFINLHDEYRYNMGVLLLYATGATSRNLDQVSESAKFRTGDFKFRDIEVAKKLLKQYSELSEYAGLNVREFAYAAHSFMRTPDYNHERMIRQIAAYGDGLHRCYTVTDFLMELENISKV